MLFMPGHKLDWMLKAGKFGADALIFDLEDAVPVPLKAAARETVGQALTELRDAPYGRFVRVNGWTTGHFLADVQAVVREGLDGIILAKADDATQVAALDLVLGELEMSMGLPLGRIEIVPTSEGAHGMYSVFDICMTSPRIKRAGSVIVAVPGGDPIRALDLRISADGHEYLFYGAQQVMGVRAAGVPYVLGGMSTELEDLDLVRRIHTVARDMGALGSMCIHPKHVPILNEVYAPTSEEVEEAKEILNLMADAVARGEAAVRFKGRMVDYAHVRQSLVLLKQAESLGMDVGVIPEVAVLSFA
jgi:citrate lyase subunit beta/citryl-CoA lyase